MVSRANLRGQKDSGGPPLTLFLDDGGVLNDNRLRALEWLQLIGEFMPARLGGTAEQWSNADRVVFPRLWRDITKRLTDFPSHREFDRSYAIDWMRGNCADVGVPPPTDDDAVMLYRELSEYVSERAIAAIDGAADAVRALHRAGYTLYTASGTASWELRGILGRMGIGDKFSGRYGPDIVDHVKYGQTFYEKVFAHAGVAVERALVIESDWECCGWATDAGANAVWIDADGRGDAPSLAALARMLV